MNDTDSSGVTAVNITLTAGNTPSVSSCSVHSGSDVIAQYGVSPQITIRQEQGVNWVLQQDELYVVKGVALAEGVFKGIDGKLIKWTSTNLQDFFAGLLYKPIGLLHPAMVPGGRSPNVGTIINIGYAKDFKEVHITYVVINKRIADAIETGDLQNSIEASVKLGQKDAEGNLTVDQVIANRVALVPNPACKSCVNYHSQTVTLSQTEEGIYNVIMPITTLPSSHDTQIIKNTSLNMKSIKDGMISMTGSEEENKKKAQMELLASLKDAGFEITQAAPADSVQLSNPSPYTAGGQDPANAGVNAYGNIVGKLVTDAMEKQTEKFMAELTPIKEQVLASKIQADASELEALKTAVLKDDPEFNFEIELAGKDTFCSKREFLSGMLRRNSRITALAQAPPPDGQQTPPNPQVTPGQTDSTVNLSAGDPNKPEKIEDLEKEALKRFGYE